MLPGRTRPRIIPVLDVMNGQVVRAVGGKRDEYRPVMSKLTISSHPIAVALALREAARVEEFYVADLDAIRGGMEVSPQVLRLVRELRSSFWIDVGFNARRGVSLLPELPNVWPVVAVETGATPRILAEALSAAGTRPVAVSLDLKAGKLLGRWSEWGASHEQDAIAVAHAAVGAGATALIVLDLARVGTGSGTGTEPLLRAIRDEFPDIDLIAGGGVRNWDDVERLGEAGADGVLVASALHDGTLI